MMQARLMLKENDFNLYLVLCFKYSQMSQTFNQAEVLNCFIQKQDSVTIPPLIDPQLQNAAFSVIEAAKSQLSELKLADLYSQQLQGEQRGQFISEFLYHWAGVDSKPPESMVESSKKSLHSIIHGFLSTHDIEPEVLNDTICPLLPYLTNVNEVDDLSSFLTRSVCANSAMQEEGANMVDLATLGTVISEVSLDTDGRSESIKQLQAQKLREIQRAFDICLNPHPSENEFESNSQQATTRAIFGSEAPTIQTQDDTDDVETESTGINVNELPSPHGQINNYENDIDSSHFEEPQNGKNNQNQLQTNENQNSIRNFENNNDNNNQEVNDNQSLDESNSNGNQSNDPKHPNNK